MDKQEELTTTLSTPGWRQSAATKRPAEWEGSTVRMEPPSGLDEVLPDHRTSESARVGP